MLSWTVHRIYIISLSNICFSVQLFIVKAINTLTKTVHQNLLFTRSVVISQLNVSQQSNWPALKEKGYFVIVMPQNYFG